MYLAMQQAACPSRCSPPLVKAWFLLHKVDRIEAGTNSIVAFIKTKESIMTTEKNVPQEDLQDDDTKREDQKSHGDQQNRTKKDGHTSQIGSGQDQISQRNRGGGAQR
jgi:hypothetical protein